MLETTIYTRTDNNGKNNEDSFFYGTSGNKTVLCVCDGVGGTDAGEIASGYVVKMFERWLTENDLTKMNARQLHSEISEFAETMHYDLLQVAYDKGISLATTFIVAIIGRNKVVIETIGDSRAYICQRGYLKQITVDQTVRMFELAGGYAVHPLNVSERRKGSLLMQCIGGEPPKDEEDDEPPTPVPVRYIVPIDERVDILLCSDGLSNKLNELNFQSQLLKEQSGDKVLTNLIGLAKKRGEKDNITAILFRRRK